MKRAAVGADDKNADGPRRSKRLAKIAAKKLGSTNNNNTASGIHNHGNAQRPNTASVVSLSSSKDETPQKIHVFKNPFPQDMIRVVDNTLQRTFDAIPHTKQYVMAPDFERRILHYKQKEAMFCILKFAFSDKTFLANSNHTRIRQDELVTLLSTTTQVYQQQQQQQQQDKLTNPFGYMGTFVEALVIRGDMVPPRSISFLLSDDEDDSKDALSSEQEIQHYKQQLIVKGEECLESLNSLDYVLSIFLSHNVERKNRATFLLQVCKSIVRVWIYVLQDTNKQWDTSQNRLQEQLDNVSTALDFCKRLSHDVQAMDVKTLLLKLVLYFSFAMESPREDCTAEERQELWKLAKHVRC